jgi:hypothetical protein
MLPSVLLDELVAAAYQNALENGYNLDLWSSHDVALDMCDKDADIERYKLEDVYRSVTRYRNDRQKDL